MPRAFLSTVCHRARRRSDAALRRLVPSCESRAKAARRGGVYQHPASGWRGARSTEFRVVSPTPRSNKMAEGTIGTRIVWGEPSRERPVVKHGIGPLCHNNFLSRVTLLSTENHRVEARQRPNAFCEVTSGYVHFVGCRPRHTSVSAVLRLDADALPPAQPSDFNRTLRRSLIAPPHRPERGTQPPSRFRRGTPCSPSSRGHPARVPIFSPAIGLNPAGMECNHTLRKARNRCLETPSAMARAFVLRQMC